MKFLTIALLIIASANTFAAQTFACRLNANSASYQIQRSNADRQGGSRLGDAVLATIAVMRSRCEKITDEASCSRNSQCVGVLVESRQVCRTEIIGITDARSNVPVQTYSDGSVGTEF